MKYVRACLAGIAAASTMWLIGMWLEWDAYPFWQTGKTAFDGAGQTRFAMIYAFGSAVWAWLLFKEGKSA